MMNCDKAKSLLSDYIEGTLEPKVKNEIDRFLEENQECKNIISNAISIHTELKQLPQVTPSAEFDSNLRNRIINLNNQEKTPALNKKGLSLVFSGTILAASLYLFIFTEIGTQQNTVDGPMPSSAIGSPSTNIQKEKSSNDNLVENKDTKTKADSLNKAPEKVDSENLHLTGKKK